MPRTRFHPSTGRYLWPSGTNQLRDPRLNPDDFSPVSGPITPSGIDRRDPRVAEAWSLGVQAADLLDRRIALLEAVRRDGLARAGEPRPAPHGNTAPATGRHNETNPILSSCPVAGPVSATGGGAAFRPEAPVTMRNGRPRSQVQMLLLSLGVGLVALAAIAFATFAYALLAPSGRAICLALLGVIALVASTLTSRRLPSTTEGLAWAGWVILTIDAWLMPQIIAPSSIGRGGLTGATIMLLALMAMALHVIGKHFEYPFPRAHGLFAAFALPLGLGMTISNTHWDGASASQALSFAAMGCAACVMAASIRPDTDRRTPDFIWLACLTQTCVYLTLATVLMPFESFAMPSLADHATSHILVIAGWAGAWAVMRRRILVSSRPLHPQWRIVPVAGMTLTAATLPAAFASLLPAMTLSWLIVGLSVSLLACGMFLGTLAGAPVPSAKHSLDIHERVPMALCASLPLAFEAITRIASPHPSDQLCAMTAYVILLAASALLWSYPHTDKATDRLSTMRWAVAAPTALTALALTLASLSSPPVMPSADLLLAMAGVASLAAGWRRLALSPASRSWATLWPGLMLIIVPPIWAGWFAEPSPVRMTLVFLASLTLLTVGAARRLQAPLICGAMALTVHVLTVLWPWIVAFSQRFWWVWLLTGGVLLIAVAARYEASLDSMRSLARRIGDLR